MTLNPDLVQPLSLAVIGLGTLGGSIAWQARRAGVPRVIGYALEPAEGVQALKADAITDLAGSPAAAARDADLVVLATPPGVTLELIGTLGPVLPPGAVLTDVCGVKGTVIARALEAGLAGGFAGAHPLHDTPESGFAAARPDRLRGCVVYICDTGGADGDHPARVVSGFWEQVIGAMPVRIGADAHDRQLAWTDHLPHAVAAALAHTLADRQLAGVSFGPGAKDVTRPAAAAPETWVDILMGNADAVAEAVNATEAQLRTIRELLHRRDAAGLRTFLTTARTFRQRIDR